ncbi:MAG: succinate dehydrogenase iron-sulfur subunit [Spirochaetaceae bacterium]|nr:MAG: succinate dehydrogenase iron-sulfur subunit [Spirochaetaceae bacterium]
MQIALEIQRFNPETNTESEFQTFNVTVEPTDRILDALMEISRNQDGTLVFRKSCAHGVCGSDAMRINGTERLACKTLVQDVADADGATVRIEPLRHLPIQRDLMVDQSVFFRKFRSVKPYFVAGSEIGEREYLQSQADRAVFDDATKCINCSACYSACPVLQKNPDFLGPAAIVQAARFVFDSRDKGLEARLDVLDSPDGVWPCENHFECTRVCPREIKITKLINLTKREIKKYREARGEATAEHKEAN